ncbi:hypothetical protein [Amycolatopsis pittospori]|uniref:hypothetical protein n=1 Tax=Amycolatopsis pittospori TaxID=2749434 RepID=UPI0015F097BF|nr:hypothetical protein [Amycolatopsis pittospori]
MSGRPEITDLLKAGDAALELTGDLSMARRCFGEAASRSDAAQDSQSLGRAALGLGGLWVHEHRSAADAARARAWQRRALGTVDPATSLASRLRLRLTAEAEYLKGTSTETLRAVEEARGSGDVLMLAEALHLAHHCLLGPQHAAIRLSLAEELLALGTTVGRPVDTLLGMLWRTVDLFLAGDPHAGRSMNELRELARLMEHSAVRFVVEAIEVMLTARSGRLAEAEQQATKCERLGTAVGDADALGWFGAHLTMIRWYEGRGGELVPLLAEVANSPTLAESNEAYFAALAVSAADAGDLTEASGALRRLCHGGLSAMRSSSTWLISMLGAAEAALLLEDSATASEAYELLLPYASYPVMASLAVVCFGSTHYPLGTAALTTGELDLAVEHLEAAVTANAELGNWPAHRLASNRLKTALRRRNGPETAIAPEDPIGCLRSGKGWKLTLGSRSAVVADSVGMRYLAVLLSRPGIEVAAADLAGSSLGPRTAQPVLDQTAKQAYRRRLDDLRTEIEDSEDANDGVRAARAREEYRRLVTELQRATGLAGRTRAFGDTDERARTATRKAIQRAITRVRAADPAIGQALDDTIVTGLRCCYFPRHPQG